MSVPENWIESPPEFLVIGDGSYSRALALIFNAPILDHKRVSEISTQISTTARVSCLNNLTRIMIVPRCDQGVQDMMLTIHAVWDCTEKLTSPRRDPELAFLLICPQDKERVEHALSAWLGTECDDLSRLGYGVAAMEKPLEQLVNGLQSVAPQDLGSLHRLVQNAPRHQALENFRSACLQGDDASVVECGNALTTVFRDSGGSGLYDLDHYCSPPCHPNGNLLRKALDNMVTEGVTPELRQTILATLA